MPLSVLGITSLTAYFGLKEIGEARRRARRSSSPARPARPARSRPARQALGLPRDRDRGRAPRSASGSTGELGFDGAIDYKGEDVEARLRELCPKGIDVFWDNVGGEILEAALGNLAMHARVVLCGAISNYNADAAARARATT